MNKEMEARLVKANDLREQEKYGESAKEYTECLLELVSENDSEGLVHFLGGYSLIYKIQARKDSSVIWQNLTLAYAGECYRIAKENKNKLDGRTLSIAYRAWADALLMSGRTEESLPVFEESYRVSTADLCEKGSVKAHIGGVKYLLGQKEEGKRIVFEALADIRTGDMSQYAPRVWETGCLNGLAKFYALEGNKDEALRLINESIDIARSYNLPIRLREAEEIKKKIETDQNDFGV